MSIINCFKRDYLKYRLMKILLTCDLLTTRVAVGISSLLFSLAMSVHYFFTPQLYELFWIIFSFAHAMITFSALIKDKTDKLSFIGEAINGFILWNYISLSLFLESGLIEAGYTATGASLAPTFVIGLSTWWILCRYPKINTKTNQDIKCQSKKL